MEQNFSNHNKNNEHNQILEHQINDNDYDNNNNDDDDKQHTPNQKSSLNNKILSNSCNNNNLSDLHEFNQMKDEFLKFKNPNILNNDGLRSSTSSFEFFDDVASPNDVFPRSSSSPIELSNFIGDMRGNMIGRSKNNDLEMEDEIIVITEEENQHSHHHQSGEIRKKKRKRIRVEASELAIKQAASLVHDAETSRFEMHFIDEKSLGLYRFYHHPVVRTFISALFLILGFILPLFETPQTISVQLIVPSSLELIIMIIIFVHSIFQYSFIGGFSYLSKTVYSIFAMIYLIYRFFTSPFRRRNKDIINDDHDDNNNVTIDDDDNDKSSSPSSPSSSPRPSHSHHDQDANETNGEPENRNGNESNINQINTEMNERKTEVEQTNNDDDDHHHTNININLTPHNDDSNNDDDNNDDNNNNDVHAKKKIRNAEKANSFFYRSKKLMKFMEMCYLLSQIVLIIEISVYIIFQLILGDLQYDRYTRILRCYLIIYHFKSLRFAFYNILKMIPKILEILFIIFSLISIYSLVSYFLFLDTQEGSLYMSSFLQTFLQYYTLMTTVNFPDVMMPTYSTDPWTSLIFISFLVFVFYFLLNLMLALIVKVYSQLMKEQMNTLFLFERQRLSYAYVLLTPNPNRGINFKTWKRFISSYKPKYKYGKTAFLFRLLNTSNSGEISPTEFSELLSILQMDIYTSNKKLNLLERMFPSFYQSSFGSFVTTIASSKLYELFMLAVVVVNIVLIVYTFIQNRSCDISASLPELILVLFFICESVLLNIAFGPNNYFTSGWHLVDFIILLISIFDVVTSYLIPTTCSNLFLKLLFFAPTLRSFRFLKLSGYFNQISTTIALILPSLLTYCAMQILMYYPWVIIGMELWAGQIYPGNPLLEGTPFAANNYYANNFNNFLYSYVTCFELMVVNNWQQIASGFIAISGEWAWLFFISFNIWTVIIIVSWVIACIIESFQIHYEMQATHFQNEIQNYITEFNKKWSQRLDYIWSARYRKRFRAALQQLYGSKEAIQYTEQILGTPDEAVASARANLQLLLGKYTHLFK